MAAPSKNQSLTFFHPSEGDSDPELHLSFIKEDIKNSKTTRVHVNNPLEEEIEKKDKGDLSIRKMQSPF